MRLLYSVSAHLFYSWCSICCAFAAFMAPEVITHNDGAGSGRASDIWSLGCVVIEMASGKVLFLFIYSYSPTLSYRCDKY